ncbi:hypothetical protein AB833_17345 [Chromatiales bacterium (ex Bugula neritina AB1)]|nr:hypothetical protein AB833_17345 [Chromatiales bacterium (ex Bugula neritina AB1)]
MRCGHRLPDILNYTLAQLNAYLEAECQLAFEQASLQLTLLAVGTQGDRRSIERLQKELDAAYSSTNHWAV